MPRGYLLLVLHAHLPFVRHPEYEQFLEERWLFEAITESYLPLLEVLERLADEQVPCRIAVSLSPPLICMLQDPLLQARYLQHLGDLIDLAEAEAGRAASSLDERALASYYQRLFRAARQRFEQHYRCDLVDGFRRLATAGQVELLTSAASHGFLPLLRDAPAAVPAQLRVAAALFKERIGWPAPGLWLPECGYYAGLEEEIRNAGFRYAFLETHGITHASPRPRHGTDMPLACGNGLALFGRDAACSQEVWSSQHGYPGHPLYREFHQDISGQREPAELGAFANAGAKAATGIKYYRITDRSSAQKQCYDPLAAQAQARRDAEDFVRRRAAAVARSALRDRPPAMLAPYDAELFGHWWFEGPIWLEQVVRACAASSSMEMLTPGDYLQRHSVLPVAQPAASSWGEGGYNGFWISANNAWIYPHLQRAARDMHALAHEFAECTAETAPWRRALNQAGRSLLLAQASDWPFILHAGTAVGYALKRIEDQLARFGYLRAAIQQRQIDPRRLQALEQMDNIFPKLDFRVFADSQKR
jgi:1,4-alpha-glucan branching enzyme